MPKNINLAGKWLKNRLPFFVSLFRKKRVLKISLYSLGATIAFLFIGILLILLFVDPNDYKTEIAAFLTENTGRTISIQDDIGYTFYPWLGLDLGKVSVGNAPGFEEPIFAHIDKAKVRVKLIPLLTQHFEIDTVRLDGIALNLNRKPDGSTNWDDLMALSGEEEQEQDSISIILKKLQVKGFDMRHASIVFDDQQTQSRYVFSDINLETSPLVLNEPIQIELNTAFGINNAITTLNGQIQLATEITALIDDQNYRLESLHFSIALQGDDIPDGSQTLSIDTDKIELDLNQQRFTLAGFIVKAMDGTLKVDIQADNALETLKLSGNLKLADLNVQKILTILPLSKDEKAFEGELLTKVGLATRFEGDVAGIYFNDIQLQADENQLKTPRLNVDFNQQSLAVDTFSIHAFGIPVEGQLDIQQLFSAPTMNGKVVLPLFNVRETVKRLEQAQLLPPALLPEENILPLKTAAFATQFQVDDMNDITLKNINLRVDDNQFKTEQVHVDLNQQTLTTDTLALESFGMQLKGQFNITKLLSETPNVEGKIDLAPFNVRETVKRLEPTQLLPVISLPEENVLPLKTAALTTQFQVHDMNDITLKNINLRVDDNQFKTDQVHLNLNQQTLTTDTLTLESFGMQLKGQFNITKLLSETPNVEGKIDLAPFNVREMVKRLEPTQLLPVISLPEENVLPLKTAAFATQFQVLNMNDITLKNINLRVDDNQFKTEQVHLNLNQQTLTTDTLALESFGMQLNGQLNITQLLSETPNVEGKIELAPFNVREIVKRLEPTQLLPVISLPEENVLPLKTAAFTTQFQIREANDITLNNIDLRVDDNQFKTSKLNFDVKKETLNAKTFTLNALGINLTGNIQAQQLLSDMRLNAKLSLAPFNPQQVLKRLGQAPLELPEPLTLTRATLKTELAATTQEVTLNDLLINVDNHQFNSRQLNINFANDTLTTNQFAFKILGATLNGDLSVEQLSTQQKLKATLKLSANPRQLMAQLKQSVPETADPKILTKLRLETQLQGNLASLMNTESQTSLSLPFSNPGILPGHNKTEISSSSPFSKGKVPTLNLNRRVEIPSTSPLEGILPGSVKTEILSNPYFSNGKLPPLKKKEVLPPTLQKQNEIGLSLNQLKIQLDESLLQGKLQIQKLQPPTMTFNLEVDNIDVDRYLPPKESEPKDKESQPNSMPSGEDTLSTLEKLRTLQINGDLRVNNLKIYSFKINDIDLNVGLKDGKFNVTPNGTFFLPSISFD